MRGVVYLQELTRNQISTGWMSGVFSVAFWTRCGRWRSTKGKGLKGRCDMARAPKSRLGRIREGKHPETGIKFGCAKVGRGLAREKESWLASNMFHDRLVEEAVIEHHSRAVDRCCFDDEDIGPIEEDGSEAGAFPQ